MAGKGGGDHPFATGLVYVLGLVIAVFLLGRFTHTDLLGMARDGSDAVSRTLGGLFGGGSAELGDLRVAEAGSMHGYRPAKFPGDDGDGCHTREEILARDLGDARRHGPCTVTSGTLHDPYTGRTVRYRNGHPGTVVVEHIVPLPVAWRSGAAGWDRAKRTRFANDPDTLVAVAARTSRDRDERPPDRWRPDRRYRCAFAQRYVTVARDYDLTVTKSQHDALATMLGGC